MAREPLTDVVVVIPGIMGSTLVREGAEVWGLSARTILSAIATLGHEARRLGLPFDLGDESPCDGVTPGDLMPDLHVIPGLWAPIEGYSGLLAWLRGAFQAIEIDSRETGRAGNLVRFAYDWRLSNRYNAARLEREAKAALVRWREWSGHRDARLVLVGHSMGGLVARHFLEVGGGAEVTRRLVTLGTPYRGALQALDRLANGLRFGLGPIALDVGELVRSLPSLHQLLPAYACVEEAGELRYLTEARVPALNRAMTDDAARFHEEIASAVARRGGPACPVHPVVGTRQPTPTTARIAGGGVEVLETYLGDDEGGDGTVPRLSARPREMASDDATQVFCAEQHGSLGGHGGVRDQLWGVLTATRRHYREGPAGADLGLRLPELLLQGEPLDLAVTADDDRLLLTVTCMAADGRSVAVRMLANRGGGRYHAVVTGLPPGLYQVTVEPPVGRPARPAKPVTGHTLVWDPTIDAG